MMRWLSLLHDARGQAVMYAVLVFLLVLSALTRL